VKLAHGTGKVTRVQGARSKKEGAQKVAEKKNAGKKWDAGWVARSANRTNWGKKLCVTEVDSSMAEKKKKTVMRGQE